MKKIVQLNVVCSGSTGKLMISLHNALQKNGYKSFCFYGRGKKVDDSTINKIENQFSFFFNVLITRLFGKHLNSSYFQTKKLIKQLKKIKPDIIQIHNIHGYWLNIPLLFKYLKNEYDGKIIWMLHDCWAFTGHCAHFTAIKCDKWKTQCEFCPQLKTYPKSLFFDTSSQEYKLKRELFQNIKNLTLVCPSEWLKNLVEVSFLREYKCEVIQNGVDLDVFKKTIDDTIKEKYNIPDNKKILLGVANVWEGKKGLDIFVDMSKIINKDTIIVLVGLSKKQIKMLPENIIGIERTNHVDDLVSIYSISDVFVNPSLEETFSLVTVEAMGCGLPVVTCDTSAINDLVNDKCGIVLKKYDYKSFYEATLKSDTFNVEDIVKESHKYTIDKFNKKYLKLYKEILSEECNR